MRLLVIVILFQICVSQKSAKRRSVNLNLETVLEFDNNENSADIQIIEKLKGFLDKVKVVIDKNKAFRRSAPGKVYKFTDFIKNAIVILKSFNNDDLEDAVSAIDDEIRKYHYKGCKFHEIVEISDVRRFMAEKLAAVKKTPAKDIRAKLNTMLKPLKAENEKVKVIFDYIDSLYGKQDEVKFKKLLEKLNSYGTKSKRTNSDLIQIVRNGIRTLIFDHYSNLESNARRNLRIKLETFWKNFAEPNVIQYNLWKFNPGKIQRQGKNRKTTKEYKDEIRSETEETVEITEKTERPKKKIKKRIKERKHKDIARSEKHSKSTKRERLTFITLYPEEIEYETEKTTDKKKKHFMLSKITSSETKSKKQKNRLKEVKNKKSDHVENFVAHHNAVIAVEKVKFTAMDLMSASVESEEPTTKKMRKNSRYLVIRKTPEKAEKEKRQRTSEARKFFKSDPRSSDEGLTIESFEHERARKSRKYNDNDTFGNNFTMPAKNESVSNETAVIKRIKLLENELKEAKAHANAHNRAEYSEEVTQYERLNFWEGTTRSTTLSTSTTTEKATTKRAIVTKSTSEEPRTFNGTIQYVNRSSNLTSVEDNEVISKLKSKHKKHKTRFGKKVRNETTTSSAIELSMSENKNETTTNDKSKEVNFKNVTALSRLDIEEFLNNTRPDDGDEVAKKAHIQMQEDLRKIFEASQLDTAGNTTTSAPETIATDADLLKDPLAVMDDNQPL